MRNGARTAAIEDALATVNAPVRLVFFERPLDCPACTPARELLEHLADRSPYISVETLNLVLEKGRAAPYGVDRAPAIVVCSQERDRIRFYGAPLGHELISFLEAIRMTASGDSGLAPRVRDRLSNLRRPVRLQVFFTPSCTSCPQVVTLANRMAVESPHVTATAIDATEFPDLVRRYKVNGVPKTVINESVEILGPVSETDLLNLVLKEV